MSMASQLPSLIRELRSVRESIVQADEACAANLQSIPAAQRASALNLVHYMALRRHDLRHAQGLLASHGLSSLGRTESHVRESLETVLQVLHALDGTAWASRLNPEALTIETGEALLTAHTDALLGPPPRERTVRIMVTMPGEAGADYLLVRDLLAAGMDCLRINCAHDGPATWEGIIHHLGRAKRELKRDCHICMDIAGPKLRTGPIEQGPAVLKIKPRRDAHGHVTKPAVIALVPVSQLRAVSGSVDAVLPLDGDLPSALNSGDAIEFDDARGRSRRLIVRTRDGALVVAELDRTAYVVCGTLLRFDGSSGTLTRRVVAIPSLQQTLVLKKGDTLLLTPESFAGRLAVLDEHDRVLLPARIGVTLPEVFRDVQPGEAIWFDDGKIGGLVRAVDPQQITVEITQARSDGAKLVAEKGINLPDTTLRLAPLTDKDCEDLAFIAGHADLVGYSFVRHAEDIYELQRRLAALHAEEVGIVLKIETQHAFNELPKLLLACMRGGRFGVMIARGDLAVECGFERMAEVQEEILWICEAAHTPVIWATQVLESLAKTGMPSRAEVTDAAMSERAECVMLNKGPFIREAVGTLDDILRRMQAHQTKKRAMLRPLQVANVVLSELSTPRTHPVEPSWRS
jgi:pyruvate kinase